MQKVIHKAPCKSSKAEDESERVPVFDRDVIEALIVDTGSCPSPQNEACSSGRRGGSDHFCVCIAVYVFLHSLGLRGGQVEKPLGGVEPGRRLMMQSYGQ